MILNFETGRAVPNTALVEGRVVPNTALEEGRAVPNTALEEGRVKRDRSQGFQKVESFDLRSV